MCADPTEKTVVGSTCSRGDVLEALQDVSKMCQRCVSGCGACPWREPSWWSKRQRQRLAIFIVAVTAVWVAAVFGVETKTCDGKASEKMQL